MIAYKSAENFFLSLLRVFFLSGITGADAGFWSGGPAEF